MSVLPAPAPVGAARPTPVSTVRAADRGAVGTPPAAPAVPGSGVDRDDRLWDHLWQTELFAASPQTDPTDPTDEAGVSPRAAYQDALAGRAVLLDLRTPAERAREGALGGGLPVRVADPGADLRDLAGAGRVHLLAAAADGIEPATLAAFDPADPRVSTVVGGFAAWRAAGLPVT